MPPKQVVVQLASSSGGASFLDTPMQKPKLTTHRQGSLKETCNTIGNSVSNPWPKSANPVR